MTLGRIRTEETSIRPNGMMVRAFDGTKTAALREIDLKLMIGLWKFEIPFVDVDIPTVFNLLLGRPWIHIASAIPSSLHHKVKFISVNKWISVIAEEDLTIPSSTLIPYRSTGN